VVNLIVKDESDGKQSIDPGDWISGIIEFIKTFFLNRGIILSEKAYVSLFLAFWTIFLIWLSSKNYSELYILPIGFFIYFLLHLLANWSWTQNVFKRMLNRPEYDIKLIKEDRKSYAEIAKIIKRHATNKPKEVIELIEEFIKEGKFKEDIQIALFNKYYTYSPTLIKYIDNILMSYDFSPIALGEYLYHMDSTNEDFLRKLVEKYKKSNSFLFNLGRFQFYKFDEGSIEKKYYNAGYNFHNFRDLTYNVGKFTYILLIFSVIIMDEWTFLKSTLINFLLIFFLSLFFFVLSVTSINALKFWCEKKKVKELLNKEQLKLEESELEKFIIELDLE
jgi:hypothetical protein